MAGIAPDPFEVGLGNADGIGVARSTDVAVGINVGADNGQANDPPGKKRPAKKKSFALFTRLATRSPTTTISNT